MIRIRNMSPDDVPLAMRLKEANGWNQTEADVCRYLDLEPDGCFVAEYDGIPVGTTTTCIFGSIAWIALVLVDAALRGRGIGRALMVHALDHLERRGVKGVRLDATPLGQPLYESLGFTADFTLERHEGVLIAPSAPLPGSIETLPSEDLDAVIRLDRAITRTDRQKLLRRLFAEFPETFRSVRRNDRVAAYLAARPGARALQLGPCLGAPEAACQLLEEARARYAGTRVFVDIPCAQRAAARWANEAGLKVQRSLLRMSRGRARAERVSGLWTSSGPEMG